MRKKKIKILHGLVNYGTQAGYLARGLRNQGHFAKAVTYYDKFNRITDFTLYHVKHKNHLIKIYYKIRNLLLKVYLFSRFNVFHFYYGTTLIKKQLDLPFYRIFGKKVIFHYVGTDVQLYEQSVKKYRITNVANYILDGQMQDRKILKRLKKEMKYADLRFVCAPIYSEFVPDASVLPLALDLDEYQYCKMNMNTNYIYILHAPTDRGNKGTYFIIDALEKLLKDGLKIKYEIAENISHEELKEKYKNCHIFIDQVLSGWYGTAAIEAMAIGRPVVCFLRKEYFRFINYGSDVPIVNANPDNLYIILKKLVQSKKKLIEIGQKSRLYVEKNHDLGVIVRKLSEHYNKLFE